MLKPNDYEYVCTTSAEIPEQAVATIRPEIAAALGESVGVMFPAFAQAFPLTVAALEAHWPKPIAAFKQIGWRQHWHGFLLLERFDLNLYFDLSHVDGPLDGPFYDQSHAMLPPKWRELYRWFESFTVTEGSVKPMDWWNTPFPYAGRLGLDQYREGSGATKSQVRDFRKKIGSTRLKCWLLTEAEDALFLDEARCDHKVYHIRGTAFDDVVVLPDADATLDRYMAHVVSGKPPAEFDFRI